MASELPLIVIVGPTASGKTALAIELAKKYGGEIICADSRTVFRKMNIGTAKPTPSEQAEVPHWGIDLVAPGDRFTAAAFQEYAVQAIADIRSRGKLPIVAGGTGLYIDGLIFSYDYPTEITAKQRVQFDSMSRDELYQYCVEKDIELPINDKNKRHLIRAALTSDFEDSRRETILPDSYVFGVAVDKGLLRDRIHLRSEHMFEDGVVNEAKQLGEKYGWESEAMTGNIYPLIRSYLEGEATKEQVVNTFEVRDWQLAKRQMTWFRRNPFISWGMTGDILDRVEQLFTTE